MLQIISILGIVKIGIKAVMIYTIPGYISGAAISTEYCTGIFLPDKLRFHASLK
jgi:hypothetical protein